MVKLGRAPTVEQFGKAFRQGFEKALEEGAGRDGRLSLREAQRLKESGNVFGDNAVNYLEKTGQQSVSVNKLLDRAEAYAFATAAKVAGPNRRLSLLEARALPKDLQADFFTMRGKNPPEDAGSSEGVKLGAALLSQINGEIINDRWGDRGDLVRLLQPELDKLGSDAERTAFAQAVADHIKANPGEADEGKVQELIMGAWGAATGHLYAPGEKDAFQAALLASDMDQLQDLFGDWNEHVMENSQDPDAMATPLFGAMREGCRMINEAAVASSNGELTMLKVVTDDTRSSWNDEGIMGGTSRVDIGQHPADSDWGDVAKKAMVARLEYYSDDVKGPIEAGTAKPVTDEGVKEIAHVISQKGMAYSRRDDVTFRMMQINDILEQLGPRSDLTMVRATTLSGEEDSRVGLREVFTYIVANKTTGQHADFYIYENNLEP